MSDKKQIKPRDIDATDVVGDRPDRVGDNESSDVAPAKPHAEQCEKMTESYGKFDSLQELLNAYNALQSEFTKRCQLVKQLQTRLDEMSAQAEADSVTAEQAHAEEIPQMHEQAIPPVDLVARSSVCNAEERLAEAVAVIAENIDECADYLASLPQIADAVILTYKKKLLGAQATASPRGMAVVMPARRPKTLSEAKRLADEMLKIGR